jgi:hypothetical protein
MRDTSLEQKYSQLEGATAPIIEKIVARARIRQLPQLMDAERDIWDLFFYHQQKRAPDAFERLGLVEDFRNQLATMVYEFERDYRPLTSFERTEIYTPEAFERMVQSASVGARSDDGEIVRAVLKSRGIMVGLVASKKKSLILGDHPQARMGPGNLDNSQTELWMPIAADVAVSPWGAAMTEELYSISDQDARKINSMAPQQLQRLRKKRDADRSPQNAAPHVPRDNRHGTSHSAMEFYST